MAKPLRVLIVENDHATLKLLTVMATLEHYSVETARTSAEAILAVDQFEPDLVLLDLALDDFTNGMDVLAHLKTSTRPPVVLVLSNHDGSERLAFEAGAAAFYQKPVDTRALSRDLERRFRSNEGAA